MIISVITVVKNPDRKLIQHCEGVSQQKGVELELLVVDGSTRPVEDAIRSEISSLGFRYVWKPDKGIYEGFNNGLKGCNGDYIHFLNYNDAFSNPNILATISPYLQINAINSCGVHTYERGKIGLRKFNKWRLFLNQKDLPHPGIILSRKLINRVGLFDESFVVAGDSDYLFRCLRNHRVNKIPFTLVNMEKCGVSSIQQNLSYKEYAKVLRNEFGLPILWNSVMIARIVFSYAKIK